VRCDVQNIVHGDTIIYLKVKAKPVSMLSVQRYMRTSQYEDYEAQNCTIYSEKFVKMMEKVRQTRHNGRMEQCDWR
jgi:hypothetical protein